MPISHGEGSELPKSGRDVNASIVTLLLLCVANFCGTCAQCALVHRVSARDSGKAMLDAILGKDQVVTVMLLCSIVHVLKRRRRRKRCLGTQAR